MKPDTGYEMRYPVSRIPHPDRPSSLFVIFYLVCGMTWVNPAMETAGPSKVPSERLGNDGDGVNLKGSDPPGAMSPDIVG